MPKFIFVGYIINSLMEFWALNQTSLKEELCEQLRCWQDCESLCRSELRFYWFNELILYFRVM